MATPSPYQADFPALFVDWASRKIEAKRECLQNDVSLTAAQKVGIEADISYLIGAIERIGNRDA